MIADFPVTKQSGQQCQRVLSEGRVDERRLSFEDLNRATAWFSVVIEAWVTNLRVKFDRGTKA